MNKLSNFLCALSLMLMMGITQAQSGGVVIVPLGGDTYQSGVAKTGQTLCFGSPSSGTPLPIACPGSGQDGEFQKGVSWPDPRFIDNLNGTVTDNLTGLIWLKDANCYQTLYPDPHNEVGELTREKALDFIENINESTADCGDTNANTDWRMPNRAELTSLLDLSQIDPALPAGHPFLGFDTFLNPKYYWTSSYHAYFIGVGMWWGVGFSAGDVENRNENLDPSFVWPVRGGL